MTVRYRIVAGGWSTRNRGRSIGRLARVLNSVMTRRKLKKAYLYGKQKGACAYCGNKFPIHWLTFDHVLRKKDGGTSRIDNLVLACEPCNVYRESKAGSNMQQFTRWHRQIIESI